MQIHGVTPEFVRELNALGYQNPPADKLIALRVHGATPEYIRDMRSKAWSRPTSTT